MPPTPSNKSGRILAIVGSVLMFAPTAGIVMTAIAMFKSFNKIMEGESEESVKASMSQDISNSLIVTTIGLGVGLLGLLLVLIAFGAFKYRKPWMWWTLLIAPVFGISLWYLYIPWLISLLVFRKKFYVKPPIEQLSNPTNEIDI